MPHLTDAQLGSYTHCVHPRQYVQTVCIFPGLAFGIGHVFSQWVRMFLCISVLQHVHIHAVGMCMCVHAHLSADLHQYLTNGISTFMSPATPDKHVNTSDLAKIQEGPPPSRKARTATRKLEILRLEPNRRPVAVENLEVFQH